MEDFGCQVATEGPPRGTIEGGVDVVLVAADDPGGGGRRRAVGEDGPVLDEGLVGEGAGRDKDCGAGAHVEGHHGAMLGMERAEDGLDIEGGLTEPQQISDHREGWRAGGDLGAVGSRE